MSGTRVVGWFQCVARAHPSALQHHRPRGTRRVDMPLSTRGNPDLSVGNWISISHLERQDAEILVDWHLYNAPRDWAHDGNVSLRSYHDRPQRRSIRARVYSRRRQSNQFASSRRSFFVRVPVAQECAIPSAQCYFPVSATSSCPRRSPPILFPNVIPPYTPAEPAPDLQLEIAHLSLIDVVGYSKLVREEKQL